MPSLGWLRELLGVEREHAAHYQCERCDREFAYHPSITDPTCPYCDSTELRPINTP